MPEVTTAAAPEPGRRERKKAQTRRVLQAEGLRLFAERGYDETTIQDITEAADVAPRTFFLHFSSKEELLLGQDRARLEEFLDDVRDRTVRAAPREAIRAALAVVLRIEDGEREMSMLRARLIEDAASLRAGEIESFVGVERALAAVVAPAVGLDPERDLYPRLLAAAALTAARIGLARWYQLGGVGDLPALGLEAYDLLTAGLAAP